MHANVDKAVDTILKSEHDDEERMLFSKSARPDNVDGNDNTYYYCQKICSDSVQISILATIIV